MSFANPKKPKTGLNLLTIILIVVSLVLLFNNPTGQTALETDISSFIKKVEEGNVENVTVAGNKVNIELRNGEKQFLYKEFNTDIYELLERGGANESAIESLAVKVENTANDGFIRDLLITFLPVLLLGGFLLFVMRSAQSSSNQALSFGKSKAKTFDKANKKTTFADVAGADEAKEELVEVVDFLKDPEKYRKIGAKIPKGALLVGRPGTGKTLLARAVAGEADVPFFNISGSEFVEMFVGVGASRVRDLFTKAKRNSPCIIFIDEIDAVGRKRGAGMGGGHDEREQTLNQILTEMDGFETGTTVIVIAATNRPDILDPALLRPGRFDRKIVVDMPDVKAREEILKVHSRNKPLDSDVDLNKMAKITVGLSGAELENLMNEAAILTARENKKKITNYHLSEAFEKTALGPAKKSRVLTKKEKERVAFHELGHAVVGHLLENCHPIHKVSIISRGHTGGVVWSRPDKDNQPQTEGYFKDTIAMALGGYVAEEIFFGETSTGPSSDLEKATNMAKTMVTKLGMSSLGPITFGSGSNEVFLGRDYGHVKDYSESAAAQIDKLAGEILQNAYKKAKEIITKNKKLIEKIAEDLIEKETFTDDEFKSYFNDKDNKSESGKA